MKEQIFVDKTGQELIVKHKKSAVYFERKANIEKENSYGKKHAEYVCITELGRYYLFSEEEFQRFCDYCESIAKQSWTTFTPKEADSWVSEYDDYYDKDFDNNGSLSVSKNAVNIEGPYAQPKSNGEIVRLIKFNKRKFESFIYDLSKLMNGVSE